MSLVVAGALGYALGSVPFGLILTRVFGAGDLRSIGSGNIGATNVLRTGRKGLAAGTLLLDGAKGAAAVLIARHLLPGAPGGAEALALSAGVGALIGHCFPVWLRFRGGKGVATMLGVTLGLAWPVGIVCLLAWLGFFKVSRISSVGGMGAAVAAPIAALALGYPGQAPVLAGLAGLVLFQHRQNITRLRAGIEPRVGEKKSGA